MSDLVRTARPDDVRALVALGEQKRLEYQTYQPRFWRKAADSAARQAAYFQRLLAEPNTICLVYDSDGAIDGFIIGAVAPAPPVYDPGGLTCLVDDFVVAAPEHWATVGVMLLDRVNALARERGCVQTVVVCGHLDEPKRAMLGGQAFSLASEWYVRDVET